jgi:hypothetical protein
MVMNFPWSETSLLVMEVVAELDVNLARVVPVEAAEGDAVIG